MVDLSAFTPALAAHADLIDPARPAVVARAPGRLDVMGGIADYSGSLVLQLPLAAAAFAAAQPDPAPAVTVRSLQAAELGARAEVRIPLAALAPGGDPLPYAEARAQLAGDPQAGWAAYVVGALLVLAHERGLALDQGMRLLIDSQVPAGKGVSSSAAIEVAAMRAICALAGIDLGGRELAIRCQQVENLVVGAPCGIMDQMTAACGAAGQLLALSCRPAELEPAVAIPAGLELWGIDSGIRHSVGGADYSSVRVGAFMGRRIIAALPGSAGWDGYLTEIPPSLWDERLAAAVPEQIAGADFLARYGETGDPVTRVDPGRTYAVRAPTAHPIREHQRVRLFRAILVSMHQATGNRQTLAPPASTTRDPMDHSVVEPDAAFAERCALLGELMYQSHAGYSLCGLGSDGTDRLVELVRRAGPGRGLYGAKITGGGSGGTVAILARAGSADAVAEVALRYAAETGRTATVLGGSSPGAMEAGLAWVGSD